jgi:translation elongation factor EF-Ts
MLMKLRQKTGFPVGKCKEALSKYDNIHEVNSQSAGYQLTSQKYVY